MWIRLVSLRALSNDNVTTTTNLSIATGWLSVGNDVGFPTGISGRALAGRAFVQAQKFGAEMMTPVAAKALDCSRVDGAFGLEVDAGERVRARAVVVASGARYRRPAIANLQTFEGHGVWYWASPIETTSVLQWAAAGSWASAVAI